MKVGFFTDTYLPTPTGRAVSIETFRKGLEQRGHEVHIFAPNFPRYQDKYGNITRLPSVIFPNRPENPFAKLVSSSMLRKIRDLEFDIIHIFSIYNIGLLGLKASKKFNLPSVFSYDALFTEHTRYYRNIFKPFAKMWYTSTCKNIANQTRVAVVPSPSAKKLAQRVGIIVPIEIVPTGIDTRDFTASPPEEIRNRFNIPAAHNILLYVGRLDEENNIKFLLRTFKLVLQKQDDTHLLIIGRGPQEDIYRKIIKKNTFGENVTFGGFMPRGELNKVYGACDIFVFPSTTAIQPIVLLEAMAAGLPIVAINRLGAADIIRDNENGFLAPLNENQFADRIIYLLNNPKSRNYFGQTSRTIAKRFTIDNSINHLEKIYKPLIK